MKQGVPKEDCIYFRKAGGTRACPECKVLTELVCLERKCSFYKPSRESSDKSYVAQSVRGNEASSGVLKDSGCNGTHLCRFRNPNQCPYLLYVTEDDYRVKYKKSYRVLKKYHLYCASEGTYRLINSGASFTGNSPVWCPKRKEMKKENCNE